MRIQQKSPASGLRYMAESLYQSIRFQIRPIAQLCSIVGKIADPEQNDSLMR